MTASERADSRRNRERIIHAARAEFAAAGLDAPFAPIARRAGVGNATLYRHFPTRDHLVREILRDDLRHNLAVMERSLRAVTAWDGFVEWFVGSLRDQRHDRGLSERLLSVQRGMDAEVDRLRDETIAGIDRMIAAATAEGTFRADRQREDVIILLYAHEDFARIRTAAGAALTRRWIDLAVASLHTDGTGIGASSAQDLGDIRASLAHRLRGEPLAGEDL
jgi:AcrR family transcriptional regulator